jgi:hypothetical protein
MRLKLAPKKNKMRRTLNHGLAVKPKKAQLIRELCIERARLREEVRQLTASILIYQELTRRSGAPTAV